MFLSGGTNPESLDVFLENPELKEVPPPTSNPIQKLIQDLRDGILAYPVWLTLGWQDIRNRYRRSILGPFWITLSLAITVSMMGVLYGMLFHQNLTLYIPYLTTGMLIWSFVSIMVNDSTTVFIKSAGIIRQIRLPLSFHVFRIIAKNLFMFFHNFIVFIVVAILFRVHLGWSIFLFPLALLILLANTLWVGLLLGAICARFRDVEQIIINFVQILFFITPVIWLPKSLGTRAWISHLNPLTQYFDILRDPLLGQVPPLLSWVYVAGITTLGWVLTIIFFSKFRARVAYWI